MILAYLPVWKPVNLFNACLATSLDKLFINFKSLQIYAKLFWHPIFMGDKVALANLKKNPIIYETISFVLSMFYRTKLCSR